MNSDETSDVIKIINQGYEKGRPVMRVDKDDHSRIEFFDVYCPKIISTRREFQDKATESRCMTHVMRETSRKDIPPNLTAEFWNEANRIRNKLLMWRFKNYHKINPDLGSNVDLGDIEPRLRQINTSFISMLGHNPEALEEFKQFLQSYSRELIEARAETIEGRIVKAICEIILAEGNLIAQHIIEKADLKDQHGNLWQPRRISSKMRELGFAQSKTQRVDGEDKDTAKVYPFTKKHLESLAKKYLDDAELLSKIKKLCYDVTDVTNVTNREKKDLNDYIKPKKEEVTVSVTTVTKVTQSQNNWDDIFNMFKQKGELYVPNLIVDCICTSDDLSRWLTEGRIYCSKPDYITLRQ